jgi:hypothetical protein
MTVQEVIVEHKYRVVLRDGTMHRASAVEHLPGFVKIVSWDGEMRLPAGDVVEIYSSKLDRISWVMWRGALAFFFVVVMAVGLAD